MKYIKKFDSISAFTQSNPSNIAPGNYYLYITYNNPDYFSYSLCDPQWDTPDFTGTTQGLFREIVPGVAKVENYVCYNNNSGDISFAPLNLEESRANFTWEGFGMTEELYNKYLQAAEEYIHPYLFNITIGGLPVYSVSRYKTTQYQNNADEIGFETRNGWEITFSKNSQEVYINGGAE